MTHNGFIFGNLQEAFNHGSDARIIGLPRDQNPLEDVQARYWDMGWDHADGNWGVDSKKPCKKLPEILATGLATQKVKR